MTRESPVGAGQKRVRQPPMKQKNLTEFETSGVKCPVCNEEFKNNKAFGPHFAAAHPDKHPATERVREAYNGDPEKALYEWYWEERMTTREIATEFNIPRDGLREVFRRFDIKTRRTGDHAQYRTNYNGYESWRSKDPDGVERSMKVHRLLAVAEFGVEAVKGNVVHHKNGIKWDNRSGNIEPMGERKHLQEHYQDREIDAQGRFK